MTSAALTATSAQGPASSTPPHAGIEVVLSGVRMPRMNSITERWVRTCRRELLDRALIWNQRHLLHALREFERFHNSHRPHQGIANARPLHPSPMLITDPEQITHLDIRRRNDSAASSTSTNVPREQVFGRRRRWRAVSLGH
ncbi:integrase core domain-containing protein [Streptomyces sp. NPDC001020]